MAVLVDLDRDAVAGESDQAALGEGADSEHDDDVGSLDGRVWTAAVGCSNATLAGGFQEGERLVSDGAEAQRR
jgi:hypothetical protein